MTITVCTTIPAYIVRSKDRRFADSWLANAEAVQASVDTEVRYYAALELGYDGVEPFRPLLDRLAQVGGEHCTFTYDDGSETITTANRLIRIVTGQNFANHYSMAVGATHMLFQAADCAMPDDILPLLLELDWPLCALDTPTYCLGRGVPWLDPAVSGYPAHWQIKEHMASAASILLSRDVFRRLRWRIDGDMGWTDDPSLYHDAIDLLGITTRVRHDHVCRHFPECIDAVETRHPSENMQTVRRVGLTGSP